MKNLDSKIGTQLVLKHYSIFPGEEWELKCSGWSFVQIESGSGYWLRGGASIELEAGTILLAAGDGQGRVQPAS